MSVTDYRFLITGQLDTSVLDYGVSLNCYVNQPTTIQVQLSNVTNVYGMNMPQVRVSDIILNLNIEDCELELSGGVLPGAVGFYL